MKISDSNFSGLRQQSKMSDENVASNIDAAQRRRMNPPRREIEEQNMNRNTAIQSVEQADTVLYLRNPVLLNHPTMQLAHPLVWIILGAAVFLAASLFPPSSYRQLFGNESVVFLDSLTYVYNGSCFLLMTMGLYIGTGILHRRTLGSGIARFPLIGAPLTSHGLMLGMIACNIVAILFFIKVGGFGILMQSMTSDTRLGHELTLAASETGTGKIWLSVLTVPTVFGPLGWQMSRTSPKGSWMRLLFLVFLVTFILAAILGGKRNFIARPLFGGLLIYLVWPGSRSISFWRAVSAAGLTCIVMLGIFLALGQLRGSSAARNEGLVESLRYMICPYNTEAMIVNRDLKVPGSGKGYFWTLWLWEFPVLSQVLHLPEHRERLMGPAPPYGAEERSGMLNEHGLSAGTNITALGESFVDFGWFGIVPFFFWGILGGIFWRMFIEEKLAGFLFYPLIAYAFLEIRANIFFPNQRTSIALIILAIVSFAHMIETGGSRRTALPRVN